MWMSEERGDTEEMDGGGGDTRSLYVALLTSCFPLLLCPLFLHSGLALSLFLLSLSVRSLLFLPFHPSLLSSVSLSLSLFLSCFCLFLSFSHSSVFLSIPLYFLRSVHLFCPPVSLSLSLFLRDIHPLPGDLAESRQSSVSGVFVFVCVCGHACIVRVCVCMHTCMCIVNIKLHRRYIKNNTLE